MYGLSKLAYYKPIEEGENLAKRDREYYDHVPGSTLAGSGVGLTQGAASGALTGYGVGAAAKRLDVLARTHKGMRKGINSALGAAGFDVDIRDITKNIPHAGKALGIGAALGAVGGMFGGAYKGMMIGDGMNDREYLMQRDLEPHEIVHNSAAAAMHMPGVSATPFSPLLNQAFGAEVGAIRRAGFKNTQDGTLVSK
jgi:hypothetical protein